MPLPDQAIFLLSDVLLLEDPQADLPLNGSGWLRTHEGIFATRGPEDSGHQAKIPMRLPDIHNNDSPACSPSVLAPRHVAQPPTVRAVLAQSRQLTAARLPSYRFLCFFFARGA